MIPRVTDELGTVSTLDDRPNDTGGLTAAELKAKFDADAGALKYYVNDVLIPFLEGTSAAASIGIATISGFSAGNIQTALEQIIGAMQEITQGSVADGSITLAKLAAEVTAIALGGAAASHTHGAGDINSGVLDAARIPVLDGTKLGTGSVGTAQLGAGSVGTEQLGAAVVTSDKLAALSVLATHIAQNAVTAQKLAPEAVTRAKMAIDAFTLADNAGAHNAVYRGKNLCSAVTAAQWAAIQAGTFKDLFIGDYWTINGINWRIAAFDYYLASDMTDHHVVIVPDTSLYTAKMNTSATTSGGYAGSQMRTTNLATAKTTINNAFGSDHILTFSAPLVNAVSSGMPSGISTYDCTVELMTERQVYSSSIFSGCPWGSSTVPALNTKDRTQFPLFALNPHLASLSWYWLRDIVTDAYFAASNGATAGYASASYDGGVRPYFCIKA